MPETTPDLERCPQCGASNPAGAAWCGQCLRRFDRPVPATIGVSIGGNSAVAGTEERTLRTLRTTGGPTVRTRDDGEPVWVCPACETENELSASVCCRCGSAFTSFFADPAADAQPRVAPRSAIAMSAALPGAGHLAMRQTGPAVARVVLYLWTLGIALMLLVWPPHGAKPIVRAVGALFALAAAAMWLLSMLETLRFVEGDRRLLVPPKALTWFTAGMTGVLFAGLLSAALVGR